MTTDANPYKGIKNYLDREPRELCEPGHALSYSPAITGTARFITGLAVAEIIISPKSLENYASAGPAVVVPDHRSKFDLTAMGTLGNRGGEGQPWFLSKRENMEQRTMAFLYGKMRTFPMDRDMIDPRWRTMLMKMGKHILGSDEEEGQQASKLVIFGEGGRKEGAMVKEMMPGSLILAKKNDVPIIPVGIAGTDQRRIRDGRLTIVIEVGEPYEVGRIKDTDLLRDRVQEMKDSARRKLYLPNSMNAATNF
ncbi:MAG: 1-acyl-sn-glycerol-3-phosphate acyltransferase [Candidatus Saccharimonadales bacterium]|jgi:1-acyl-sn-glycerol-3-phosphate acyltransferase